MSKVASWKPNLSFKNEWSLSTLDIVIAVIIGVIEAVIEITGALGFIERFVWATGPFGFVLYNTYNGLTGTLYMTVGYLRRKMGVLFVAGTVMALARWFTGDPDGPLLIYYTSMPIFIGGLAMWKMGWKDRNSEYWVGNGLFTMFCSIAPWTVMGGLELAGGPMWALLALITAFVFGGIQGVLGRYIGIALEKVGIQAVDRYEEAA